MKGRSLKGKGVRVGMIKLWACVAEKSGEEEPAVSISPITFSTHSY